QFCLVDLGLFTRYALGTAVIALCVAAVWFVTPTVLGSRYTRLGDGAKEELEWDQARDYYKKAITIDRKCWQPYRNLADTCRQEAEWRDRSRVEERKQLVQEALKNYSMAQTLNPLNADLFVGQAQALETIGENKEALKCYDRALRLDPNNAFVFATLGRLYRNMGDAAKAAEAFKRSYELKCDVVMAWMNLEE